MMEGPPSCGLRAGVRAPVCNRAEGSGLSLSRPCTSGRANREKGGVEGLTSQAGRPVGCH